MLGLEHFPKFNCKANKTRDSDDGISVIVKHIENYNYVLKNIEENRSDRETFNALIFVPKLDVIFN